jgi:GNAT superfamily N-acetyltransferase
MTEIRIAEATPFDIEPLHALVESAYRGERSREGWTTEADLLEGQRTDPDELRAIIANPTQTILCARYREGLYGCVMLADWGAGCGYLGMLSVSPAHQGAGLGRQLVAAAEAKAKSRFDAKRMRISVFPQRETLIAWYERLGYRLTGDTLPFPYGNPRYGLPKRDDLYFVVMERALQ